MNTTVKTQDSRRAVSNRIFDTLKDQIVSGKYAPGEKLPSENQLCDEFGVSRVTVRAALDRLRGIGLLRSQRGGGTYVLDRAATTASAISSLLPLTTLGREMRMDMFEFRRILEVESAGLAAMRADTKTVRQMLDTVEIMRRAADIEEIAKCDLNFHQLIAEATRNEIILRVFEALKGTYFSLFKQNVSVMGAYGADDHERICRLIEVHDVEEAKKCMAMHISQTIRHTEEFSAGNDIQNA